MTRDILAARADARPCGSGGLDAHPKAADEPVRTDPDDGRVHGNLSDALDVAAADEREARDLDPHVGGDDDVRPADHRDLRDPGAAGRDVGAGEVEVDAADEGEERRAGAQGERPGALTARA
jgi:hypothetical protein